MKKDIIADEMHKVEILDFTNDESKLSEYLTEHTPMNIWDLAEADLTALTRRFISEGLPDPRKKVIHKNGPFWSYHERRSDYVIGSTISPGFSYIQAHTDRLSDIYLAADVAKNAMFFLQKFRKGDLERAVGYCAQYVSSRHVLTSRQAHLKSVTRGRLTLRGSKQGAEQTAKKRETLERRERILNEMRRLIVKGHTPKNAAAILANRKIGTSEGANRQIWYRYRKKL